jgi:3-oxoacyl-[acyl-carrier protein] reductase
MKLDKKVALITGGAQGLGKALALAMAKEGADIVICDINESTLPGTTSEIEAVGRKCLGVRCDVSSSESVGQMYEEVVKRFGVNNASLVPTKPADDFPLCLFNALTFPAIPSNSLKFRPVVFSIPTALW